MKALTKKQEKDILKKIGIVGKQYKTQILFNAKKWLDENFTYMSESVQYPDEVKEVWDIWRVQFTADNKLFGDCDEFGLAMIYLLLMAGFKKADLAMVVGFAPSGEGHFFTFVGCGGNLWLVDNYSKNPLPVWYAFNSVGYRVGQNSNGIARLDKPNDWRELTTRHIPKPKELQGLKV